jgi:hypothetical protein
MVTAKRRSIVKKGKKPGDAKLDLGEQFPRLSAQQFAWAEAYLRTFSKTKAAEFAKLKPPFAQAGHDISRHPSVQEYVRLRIIGMLPGNKDEVLARLNRQTDAPWDDILDLNPDGSIKAFNFDKAKKAGVLGLIKKISINPRSGHESVEVVDPQGALDKVAKAMKLYGEETLPPTAPNTDRRFWEGQ